MAVGVIEPCYRVLPEDTKIGLWDVPAGVGHSLLLLLLLLSLSLLSHFLHPLN
jgi:hypothetical protein